MDEMRRMMSPKVGEKESIGTRVRRLRLARRLSQNELARMIGMSRQAIFEMESQRRKYLMPETLEKLSAALDVTEEELAYGYKPVEHPEELPVEVVLRAQGIPEEHINSIMALVNAVRREQQDRGEQQGTIQASA